MNSKFYRKGQIQDRYCSTSLNEFTNGTKVQKLRKDQESTPGWINTVTSEDFRRECIGRPKTVNIYCKYFFKCPETIFM